MANPETGADDAEKNPAECPVRGCLRLAVEVLQTPGATEDELAAAEAVLAASRIEPDGDGDDRYACPDGICVAGFTRNGEDLSASSAILSLTFGHRTTDLLDCVELPPVVRNVWA